MTTSVLLRAHVGVIGEAEVGKTALLKAFEKKHYFQQQYIMTQSAQVFVQVVHLDDARHGERHTDAPPPSTDKSKQHEHAVELFLTEVGGHALLTPLKHKYLTDCPYLIACFDTTRRTTLDAVIQQYLTYKQHLHPSHPTPQLALLVGCKSDRRADSEVAADECDERASEAGLAGYVECSAATGDGVEELFERIARHVAEQHDVGSHSTSDAVEGSGDEESASPHGHAKSPAKPQQSRQLNADSDSDDD